MSFATGLVYATTYRTDSGSVARINLKQWHACEPCFVGDELFELIERPVSVSCPLRLPNRDPRAYPCQILYSDSSMRALGLLHDTLANDVIRVLLEVSLFARKCLEFAFGCLDAFTLKIAATMGQYAAAPVYRLATESLTIRVGSQIDYAQVNAKDAVRFLLWGFLDIARRKEVKVAFDQGQVALALLGLEQAQMVVSADKSELEPSRNRSDRDSLRPNVPTQDVLIEGNSTVGPERVLRPLVQLIGVGRLGDATHYKGRIEAEAGACGVIHEFVKGVLAKCFALPRLFTDPVAGNIALLYRGEQGGVLFGSREEPRFCSESHISSIGYSAFLSSQRKRRKGTFLSRINAGVPCARRFYG